MKRPSSIPLSIPSFREGNEYRWKEHPRCPWICESRMRLFFHQRSPIMPKGKGIMCHHRGTTWMIVRPHSIEIAPEYAWNGNTGWFDTKGTMLASFFHDPIFQFSGCVGWPEHLDLKWANDLYYHLAKPPMAQINRLGLAFFSPLRWKNEVFDGETVEEFYIAEPV